MRTIIIPDLHNRVDWIEPFLSSISYDRVVLLGDYFDDFGDTAKDIKKSANWLKQSLKHEERIHLFGTHDLWYRYPYNPFLIASGNSGKKSEIISKILYEDDWNLLHFFYIEQTFLLTHAGLHPSFVKNDNPLFSLGLLIDEAISEIRNGFIDPILNAGLARGGNQPFGGITWLDWHDEFEIIPNLNQIVGHTQQKIPTEKSTINSKNYCIDTQNRHIGIIEKNVFSCINK